MVRTRRARAIEERYYGRVARTLYVGVLSRPEDKQVVAAINGLAEAAAESAAAHAADQLRCTLVHARIPVDEVRNLWAQVQELARRFAQIPRAGGQVYGSPPTYPTDAPTLPTPSTTGPSDATQRPHRRRHGRKCVAASVHAQIAHSSVSFTDSQHIAITVHNEHLFVSVSSGRC